MVQKPLNTPVGVNDVTVSNTLLFVTADIISINNVLAFYLSVGAFKRYIGVKRSFYKQRNFRSLCRDE